MIPIITRSGKGTTVETEKNISSYQGQRQSGRWVRNTEDFQGSENPLSDTIMMDVCLVAHSCPTLMTPWTVAHQAPLSMGFFRQEYWSGQPFPPPGDLPNLGVEQADSLLTELHIHNNGYMLLYPIECAPRVDPKANYGLWVMMMCPYLFISCNKRNLWGFWQWEKPYMCSYREYRGNLCTFFSILL